MKCNCTERLNMKCHCPPLYSSPPPEGDSFNHFCSLWLLQYLSTTFISYYFLIYPLWIVDCILLKKTTRKTCWSSKAKFIGLNCSRENTFTESYQCLRKGRSEKAIYRASGVFKANLTRQKLTEIGLSLWETNFGLIGTDEILKQMLVNKLLVLISTLHYLVQFYLPGTGIPRSKQVSYL